MAESESVAWSTASVVVSGTFTITPFSEWMRWWISSVLGLPHVTVETADYASLLRELSVPAQFARAATACVGLVHFDDWQPRCVHAHISTRPPHTRGTNVKHALTYATHSHMHTCRQLSHHCQRAPLPMPLSACPYPLLYMPRMPCTRPIMLPLNRSCTQRRAVRRGTLRHAKGALH